MADVVLSGAIRSNLLSMQNTARLLDESQLRLATGLKVRSAVDSPTAFFTAQGLNNRASDLNNLLDSMGQAVQTLEAADEGIKSILKLVDSMKAVANQALETKIKSATLTGNQTGAPLTGGVALSGLGALVAGNTITITVGEVSETVTIGGATGNVATVQDLIDWANDTFDGDEPLVASLTPEGQLQLEGKNGRDVTVTAAAGVNEVSLAGLLGTRTSATEGVNRDKYERDFNNLREQIADLAKDAHYKGVNLLKGDVLSVFFNA